MAWKFIMACVLTFFSFPYFTIASANGCSDFASRLTATHKIPSSSKSCKAVISVTSGFPSVMVPVLSKIIVSTLHSISNGSPPLIRIHFSAHFPVPTINAVGVASHKAQGQAITITAAKYKSAVVKLTPTMKNRIRKTSKAIPITVGTNIAEILSANHWIGALDHWASWINLMICASAVSFPIFCTSNSKLPNLFIVPPKTFAPTDFSTGILSPVSMDSSILECHETILPSIGTFSPGFTKIISHFFTSSMATSI